jgi:hypothetical protein
MEALAVSTLPLRRLWSGAARDEVVPESVSNGPRPCALVGGVRDCLRSSTSRTDREPAHEGGRAASAGLSGQGRLRTKAPARLLLGQVNFRPADRPSSEGG